MSLLAAGCGGGGAAPAPSGGGGTQTPPDFALTIPAQLTVQSGGLPQPFQIAFESSQNNLPVTVTISGLGSGLNLYGGSTYKFTDSVATPSYTWAVGAGAAVSAGASGFSVSATNGSVTHSWTVNVTVTQAAAFQVSLSPSTLTLMPGQSSMVQATITGSNIPSDISLQVGSYPGGLQYTNMVSVEPTGTNSSNLLITAGPGMTPATVALFVQAYSGTTTSSAVAVLNFTIPGFPAVTRLTRSNFVRAGDTPWGGVYDAARKLVFVAYGHLNQVVAYSSVDQHIVATIPVPQYQLYQQAGHAIDESADGSRVYVASAGQIAIIDPGLMQVVAIERTPMASSLNDVPLQLATLADGKVLVENSDSHVYLWDPTAHTFQADDPPSVPGAAFNGFLTRSADHSKVLLSGSTAAIFFLSGSDSYGNYGTNLNGALALNPDGSQLVSVCSVGGPQQLSITFYDDAFNAVATPMQSGGVCFPNGTVPAIYGLDGKTVYLFLSPFSIAYDAVRYTPVGLFAAFNPTAVTQPFVIDESGLVFGSSAFTAGLAVTDVSDPGDIEPDNKATFPFPGLQYPQVVANNALGLNSSIQSQILGSGFDSNTAYSVYVGAPPGAAGSTQASGVSVASSTRLNFSTPAGSTPGPVNVTVTRPDGWNEVIPDGLTYGPGLIAVYPNAIPATQPASITAVGYGIGMDGETATVGASSATDSGGGPLSTFNLYYPLLGIPIKTSSGTPGWADVTITNRTGTTTLHHAVQFLKSMKTYPMTGSPDAIVYDQTHQRLYVSNTTNNNVAVFDLASSTFEPPIAVGNGPTRLALSSDNSTLAVLNGTDATVSVIDTKQLKVVATWAAVTTTEKSGGGIPSILAFAAPHDVVVGFGGPAIHLLDLTTGMLSCTGVAGCDSTGVNLNPGIYAGLVASSPDGRKIAFSSGSGEMALLDMTQNSLTSAPAMFAGSHVLAIDADKDEIVDNLNTYDALLHPLTSTGGEELYYTGGLPSTNITTPTSDVLNASGSLLFAPASPPQNGVVVLDVRHGSVVLRIAPADQNAINALALDETGTRLFCLSPAGIAVIQLYEDPLSIGSVAPGNGAAGATVTIRGSGFESGTMVSFGSTKAVVTFVDAMTLQATVPSSLTSGPVQITVTNPDGSHYALDAAFTVN